MKKLFQKKFALFLAIVFLFGALSLLACAEDPAVAAPEEAISFMTYEEAVACYNFDKPAYNWCINFGWDPETRREEAKEAILSGTNRQLIIALATYFRDTGHGDEPIIISNAFRPACYQEVIGLHDSNIHVGPYRKAMRFNGKSVTDFWWAAEKSYGWPRNCTIDLSEYDIGTLDLRYFYRACLRMWDNGWVNAYYARPGCSTHNSGCAMDVQNYWIATNFATGYEYNGKEYAMEDYGLYKPLQPTKGSAGEAWHITCTPAVLALGNYDMALLSDFEIIYCLYYNPTSRGWTMDQGRGVYLGAGVVILQIALTRLGLLEPDYITGYYCSATENAVIRFQQQNKLEPDGICGGDTMSAILSQVTPEPEKDAVKPVLLSAGIVREGHRGFVISVQGKDETRLNAFRVDTRKEGGDTWVTRYYNAPVSGSAELDVDIWEEGRYETRVAACDSAGNESAPLVLGEAFIDTTAPVIASVVVSGITEMSLHVTCTAEDNGELDRCEIRLKNADGTVLTQTASAEGNRIDVTFDEVPAGEWNLSVTAVDAHGNSSQHTMDWVYCSGQTQILSSVRWYAPSPAENP